MSRADPIERSRLNRLATPKRQVDPRERMAQEETCIKDSIILTSDRLRWLNQCLQTSFTGNDYAVIAVWEINRRDTVQERVHSLRRYDDDPGWRAWLHIWISGTVAHVELQLLPIEAAYRRAVTKILASRDDGLLSYVN